jgi:hypothetical protein
LTETGLIKPRPAVRYTVNSGFSSRPARGKNYRMPGATMVTYRQREDPLTGEKEDVFLDAAKNPPNGALVQYYLSEVPDEDITLTFLDASGKEIRSFSSHNPEDDDPPGKRIDPRVPKAQGLNRFVWNLRYPDATRIEDDDAANDLVEGGIAGPVVPPGSYRVRLSVGSASFEEAFEVRPDPRSSTSAEDFQAQFDALLALRDKISEIHANVNQIRALRKRSEDWLLRGKETPAIKEAAQNVIDRLKPIEGELIQAEAKSRGDTLNMPVKLNGKLAVLVGVVSSADGPPTRASQQVVEALSEQMESHFEQLRQTVSGAVEALNAAIRDANLPPVGA